MNKTIFRFISLILLLIIGCCCMVTAHPVTLYSSTFGEYGIIYNNTKLYAPTSDKVVYQIPDGTKVKVFSTPYSNTFSSDIMWMKERSGYQERGTELKDGQTITIDAPTTFDDNYKTTTTNVVYLAIPNNGGYWVRNAAKNNCLYAFHSRTEEGKGSVVKMDSVGLAKVELGSDLIEHIYYRCEVPTGCNTIRFEKRTALTAFGDEDVKTIDLRYQIPLNSINCYRLDRMIVDTTDNNGKFAGLWEAAPGLEGDYRLVHVREYGVSYPSDIIRKGTKEQIVSLHIYAKDANDQFPKLELQKCVKGAWVTQSTTFVKDIAKIINDKTDNGSGVWNFVVSQDANCNATINYANTQRYAGNYYIRTNNTLGGWRNYTLYTNKMNYSAYAKENSNFSHYYCRHIDIDATSTTPGKNKNVKFIVANDYSAGISNELATDTYTIEGGILPEDANVRWSWNEVTNEVSRSYIGNNGIQVTYNSTEGTASSSSFKHSNWIYDINLTNVGANSTLKLSSIYQNEQIFADELPMLITSNANSYSVRLMYDFKIDKPSILLIPDHAAGDTISVSVDMFIDRINQEDATQVKAAYLIDTTYTVYATMTFTQNHLEDPDKTEWEKLYYWISFPFNVRISDIFGFGEYGKDWLLQYYDGAARAKEGNWIDSPTFWRWISDTTYTPGESLEDKDGNPSNGVLVANKGYVLVLPRSITNKGLFTNGNDYIRLYFPSMVKIDNIDGGMQDICLSLPEHTCTIQRDNRHIYDSHWQIIGVPSYANKNMTIEQDSTFFYYQYNATNNTYEVNATKDSQVVFKSMHAYMVQFAGELNWREKETPKALISRKNTHSDNEYNLRLELQQDGAKCDQTYITLQEDNCSANFDFNYDLSKIVNMGTNIYSLIPTEDAPVKVAANALPLVETIIPIGTIIETDGEYTFSMPDGTAGITSELIDYETNTRINLLLSDYTIYLHKGTYNNRFALHVKPNSVATNFDYITDDSYNTPRKFIIDGTIYLQCNGILYNAMGRMIK